MKSGDREIDMTSIFLVLSRSRALPLFRPHALTTFRSPGYSGLMPAAFATLAHFSISARMNAAYSAGPSPDTS